MINRFIYFVLFITAITSCNGSKEKVGIEQYKISKIDTSDMFFTGEYYSIGDLIYFKDCATNRIMNLQSDRINEIEELYLTSTKGGSSSFCSLRGEFNPGNSTLQVKSFLGFNITNECAEEKLNRTYALQGDSLTLTDDYKYTFKINGSDEISGKWARQYKDLGVLSLGNGDGIEFVINIGLKSSNNNLFLSFKGEKNGNGMIFMPVENINIY